MTNVCERWSQDHTNALQGAWFNGVGFETWENVWGTWNGMTERDCEQTRRLRVLMRFLGGRGYLQSQGWLPHSGAGMSFMRHFTRTFAKTGSGQT